MIFSKIEANRFLRNFAAFAKFRKKALAKTTKSRDYDGLPLFSTEDLMMAVFERVTAQDVSDRRCRSVLQHLMLQVRDTISYKTSGKEHTFMDTQICALEYARLVFLSERAERERKAIASNMDVEDDDEDEEDDDEEDDDEEEERSRQVKAYLALFATFLSGNGVSPAAQYFARRDPDQNGTTKGCPAKSDQSGQYKHVGYGKQAWRGVDLLPCLSFDIASGDCNFRVDLRDIPTTSVSQRSYREWIKRTDRLKSILPKCASDFVGMYCPATFNFERAIAKTNLVLPRSPSKPRGRAECTARERPLLFKSNELAFAMGVCDIK